MADLAPTTCTIPTLETERLFLRAPREADFDDEAAFWASGRSAVLDGPLPRDRAYRVFLGVAGHWLLKGYGFWALEEKASGRYLGRVGLWYPEGWPEPEVGWMLTGDAEGRGLAFEAARAARRYAYDTLGWTTAISLIRPDNARSAALAARLGAVRERIYRHPAHGPMEVWRHPGPEAAA